MTVWPSVSAFGWHLRHGNTIALEGHTFHIPISYKVEVQKGGKSIELDRESELTTPGEIVTIEAGSHVLSQDQINVWQTSLLNAFKTSNQSVRNSTITLNGRHLTFQCVDMIYPIGESLICHVPDTDISASTSAFSPQAVSRTRAILETSD